MKAILKVFSLQKICVDEHIWPEEKNKLNINMILMIRTFERLMSVETSLKTFLLKRISKAKLKGEKIDAGDFFTDYFKFNQLTDGNVHIIIVVDSLIKNFMDIGYSNLSDIILWWMDEKELYEEANVEEIMMSYFKEKFRETSNFMDIVHNNYFYDHEYLISSVS
uniref:Uncharacterized protein n=2 Tax=Rhizophagus irregularis TaxID=588596 RepID=U9UW71_RHIID